MHASRTGLFLFMATKLGFTWYPQDWWSSDSFFELDPFERYIYLECLFIMYRNNGYLKTQKTQFENRIRVSVDDLTWEKVTSKFIIEGDNFTSLTVNTRLRKAIVSRENGQSGGRPRKENPENPTLKPKEKEKEKVNIKESNTADKSATKTLDDRKKDFYNSLKPFVKDYSKKMLREFYDYWTEASPNGKKMRFEKQTVFETKRRLVTWAKRAGIEPPEPHKPAQERFSEAAYNKTLWTTEAWESHYGWRLESEPEFRQYFGYGELQKS